MSRFMLEKDVARHAQEIVERHQGEWNAPPKLTDTGQFTDAPLLGNGDVGVMILGTIDDMAFVAGKNEFLSQTEGRQKAMARLRLLIPGFSGASHRMEQRLAHGEAAGEFVRDGETLAIQSWVQATDTTANLLIVRFKYDGSEPLTATVRLAAGRENEYASPVGSEDHIAYLDVRADAEDWIEGYPTARARIAVGAAGTAATADECGELQFTIRPGQDCAMVACIMSVFDAADYPQLAVDRIRAVSVADVEALHAAHRDWWRTFWSRSYVELGNKTVEKQFYGSLYLLGSCMRAGEQSPGLYGGWAMKNPAWAGEPPLNYNYEAPYYCTIPTNHADLAENYEKLILDWVPNAEENARKHGFSGVYYEAYPGPLPRGSMFSACNWTELDSLGRDCFMNQKSNAALAASPMIIRYYYTRDTDYAARVYDSFLKKVAAFWVDYLRWDGSRYVIDDDFVHEGPNTINPQTNPLTSLGFVRLLFQGVIAIAADLDVDADLRLIWQEKLDKLSAFPTFTRNGRTVFKNQEAGTSIEFAAKEYGLQEEWSEWSSVTSIPAMALIYPGGQIGLCSDSELVSIAKETIAQQARWQDDNMTCFFYPSAARVGHDPREIMEQMTNLIQTRTHPNMTYDLNGGGIENFNVVPAALVEMLAQSFQGKLRVFACWPQDEDAKFANLMAYGHFLVSSERRNNFVTYVRIVSKRGRELAMVNPWNGSTVRIYRDGEDAGTAEGEEIMLRTSVGETIHLAPEGTAYEEVVRRVSAPLS